MNEKEIQALSERVRKLETWMPYIRGHFTMVRAPSGAQTVVYMPEQASDNGRRRYCIECFQTGELTALNEDDAAYQCPHGHLPQPKEPRAKARPVKPVVWK